MTAEHKSETCCSHTAADTETLSSQEPAQKVCSCCCTKHTDRSEAERKKLVNRLKRIEGQIRGIIGMLENDAYCNDILIQSAAVNAAMLLIESFLPTISEPAWQEISGRVRMRPLMSLLQHYRSL